MLKQTLKAVAIIVALALLATPVGARVQDDDDGLCWDPDIEFPIPCGEDEE